MRFKYGVILLAGLLAACAGEVPRKEKVSAPPDGLQKKLVLRTDSGSISAGKTLFSQKCEYCHNAYSSERLVGPGLKGILKNPLLPVSGQPATPESIAGQIKHPRSAMPSFVFLTDDDIVNIISFLNTL